MLGHTILLSDYYSHIKNCAGTLSLRMVPDVHVPPLEPVTEQEGGFWSGDRHGLAPIARLRAREGGGVCWGGRWGGGQDLGGTRV